MSTDTIALFEVADTRRALESIHDSAVRDNPDALCAVAERYLDYWRPKQWEYDDSGDLLGPGGFFIRGNNGIVEVYHLLPYSTFTLQADDGRLVFAAFRFIGRIVGSADMIVMHELLPWEGSTLDAASRSIETKIGQSASSWKELSACELFEPGCWMRIRDEQ